MKYLTVTITLLMVITISGFQQIKNESDIEGTWRVINTATENTVQFGGTERMITVSNGTFESFGENYQGIKMVYNSGKYFVPKPGTIITVHTGRNGELSKTANYYNYEISGDTLHFYGNFFREVKEGVLIGTYIDEKWVKAEE